VDAPNPLRSTYVARLEDLLGLGQQLQNRVSGDPMELVAGESVRIWQRECAALISDLSGGNKSHWLSRAHSEAFLVRSADRRATLDAPAAEIVGRLLDVLKRAMLSLAQPETPSSAAAGGPTRFDFVHDAALRPVLEMAYLDGRRALDERRFGVAFLTSCSLLEAIVTDALTHAGAAAIATVGGPGEPVATWSFDVRLGVAERAGLIGSGCARLPEAARRYRDLAGASEEPRPDLEREARVARQVLHVVMRDLNPGR